MKKIYIISRYRALSRKQMEFNKKVARHFCRKVVDEGNEPVAPHLFFTQFLDDNYEDDRNTGLYLGKKQLMEADEFLLVIIDEVISEGMHQELSLIAKEGNKKGRIVSMTRQEAEEAMKVVR